MSIPASSIAPVDCALRAACQTTAWATSPAGRTWARCAKQQQAPRLRLGKTALLQRGRAQLAVSVFGALALLEAEHGLHVIEEDGDDGVQRVACAVRIAPDLPGRARPAQPPADEDLRVCRRYRAAPSPLVRDAVRGWRTGRIDRVLAGEFDAIVGE